MQASTSHTRYSHRARGAIKDQGYSQLPAPPCQARGPTPHGPQSLRSPPRPAGLWAGGSGLTSTAGGLAVPLASAHRARGFHRHPQAARQDLPCQELLPGATTLNSSSTSSTQTYDPTAKVAEFWNSVEMKSHTCISGNFVHSALCLWNGSLCTAERQLMDLTFSSCMFAAVWYPMKLKFHNSLIQAVTDGHLHYF